ncbi:MAG TPA: DUF305 domain-containing protein [Pyrinomonadaceae bacterium]|nr:DUF305 domain-containing protein [Pyrinomonadaceae bacterium]
MHKYIVLFLAILVTTSCSEKTTKSVDHSKHGSSSTSSNGDAHDKSSMDHSSMASSPGASSAPLELQFIDTMIVHHEGAIDMAELAESYAGHPELKQLAADIVREQMREIDTMEKFRDRWFGDKDPAINMEFPGMSEGMHGMDLHKLGSLRGNEFDLEFIRQMIPHHEGALVMAKQIKDNDSYAELKRLADDIIRAQEAEIATMRGWLTAWERK